MENDPWKEIEADPSSSSSSSFVSLIDLMTELWDASVSATRNLRLLIAVVSSYLAKRGKAEGDARRASEGREMRRILMDIYRLWTTSGSFNSPTTTVREMHTFVRYSAAVTKELHAQIVKGLMTGDTYEEWVREYRTYIGRTKGANSRVSSAAQTDPSTVEEGDEERCDDDDDGLDAVLESVTTRDVEPIAQNVTKVENGQLSVMRTPGEVGDELVRVNVYNVRDIASKDRRHWWRYAKLRAQFLCSSTRTDRKRRAVRRLFDVAARDMKSVPGVAGERRDLFRATDSGKRKRDPIDDDALRIGSEAREREGD